MSIKITSKPLSSIVNPTEGQIEIFADSENGNHLTVITSGGTVYDLTKTGESNIIEKTYSDLTTMITNSELVPGVTYKITGVHKAHTIDDFPLPISALYDDGRDLGTTIFLKSISENELETFGSGIFYNPKYDKQVQGFGIWSNKIEVALKIFGTFDISSKEGVTADNGAKGRIIAKGWIEYISGDWGGAKSIKGENSGAKAHIGGITVPNYNVDDIVFWGGYAWKNLNGDIGSSIDVLSLDGEWEKLNYDDVNYNKVVDYIEYDIEKDLITRRYDTVNDIDVSSGFLDLIAVAMEMEGVFSSPVSLMQWGNDLYMDVSSESLVGVGNVSAKHMSFVELINFKGVFISNVTFNNNSGLFNVTFDNGSSLFNVTFDNGSSLNRVTFDNGSRSFNITLNDSSMRNVTFDNGANLNNVVLNGSYLRDVTLDNGSYLQYVTFDNKSSLLNVTLDNSNLTNVTLDNGSYLQFVTLIGSYLRDVTLDNGSRLSGLTLDNKSNMTNNTFVNFISNFNNRTYNNLNLSSIKFEGNGVVSSIFDLSNATIITDSSIPQKKVFGNDQTTIKIQYWNTSQNDFAIADITD